MHRVNVAFRVVCAWSHCCFQGCVSMESLLLSGSCVHRVNVAFRVVCAWSRCCFQGRVCIE